jgi:hypothetical protein
MRQAKVRLPHLLRTVIYACDDSILLLIAFSPLYFFDFSLADRWRVLLAAVACTIVTSYRLSVAFKKYLRVHRPVATVLTSQLIAVLLCLVIVLYCDIFWARV